jgi:hypothetical protein
VIITAKFADETPGRPRPRVATKRRSTPDSLDARAYSDVLRAGTARAPQKVGFAPDTVKRDKLLEKVADRIGGELLQVHDPMPDRGNSRLGPVLDFEFCE